MDKALIWWRRNSLLLQEVQTALLQYPKLILRKTGDAYLIQGEWDVFGASKFIRSYQIRVNIPDDYPQGVPQVLEIGGDIPKNPDRHINSDHTACLFAPPQRWEKWPPNLGMSEFLDGPVKEFFFSQAFFDLEGKWPFGEWQHGNAGIVEYYLLKLELSTGTQLKELLQFLPYSSVPRQSKCPCDHGKRLRQCHWDKFVELRNIIPAHEWDELKKILK